MNIKKWLADKDDKWYYRPWVVLVMLILVLGPLGLPLVYKSPKFNLAWKIGLTLLMILYTWSMIVGSIEYYKWLMSLIEKMQGEQMPS